MSAEILSAPFRRHPIELGDHLSLPLDVVAQSLAIIGKSGSGKSYCSRRFVEQLLKAGQQVVILDPKGDWSGLRTSHAGDGPGFPVPILGGNHGDADIDVAGGARLAELVVTERASMLLDLSHLRRDDTYEFLADFLEALYRLKARAEHQQPMMLVIDEADMVAPQRPPKGAGEMLAAADDIVRRGRQRGIGVTLITQRAAVLSKNVLSQAQVLLALRTIAPGDLSVMKSWVECHASAVEVLAFMSTLPGLPRGECWAWSPGWPTPEGIRQRVRILPIETFDSGASPLPGQPRPEPQVLAEIDQDLVARVSSGTPAPEAPPPAPPSSPAITARPSAVPKVVRVERRTFKELVEAFERETVASRIDACHGNMTAAAASLGIERSYLYRLCNRLGITRPGVSIEVVDGDAE